MEDIKRILTRFENIPSVQQHIKFNNGLEKSQIVSLFEEFGIYLSNEIIQLYQWHNGIKNDVWLYQTASFLPVQDILVYYKFIKENNERQFFYKELLPIFFDDDTLFVNIDKKSINYGRVYIKNAAVLITEPMPIFDSLANMFLTIVDGFENNIYFLDCTEFDDTINFCTDYEKIYAHGKSLNPNCIYWDAMTNIEIFNNYSYLS